MQAFASNCNPSIKHKDAINFVFSFFQIERQFPRRPDLKSITYTLTD